ncbi:MAG: alpha-amylase [Spirochaetales bacterium]|nr:alpha-amylase [Spirochaetales bacterium]
MQNLCKNIYGKEKGRQFFNQLQILIKHYKKDLPNKKNKLFFTQKDVILITYADQIQKNKEAHLKTLHQFLNSHIQNTINSVHLLPFFPYSSDDGFSVIDYKKVQEENGTWDDIKNLGQDFKLAFDGVINHVSQESSWFQEYLKGNPAYDDFFISLPKDLDLSHVVRPRPFPLLSDFQTTRGKEFIWTTFSRDQIDLNYANPEVLLKIIDVILFYAAQGAKILRLDAIAFLWKEVGTSCLHHPKTHMIVKLIRKIFDSLKGDMVLLTETNVPHDENISYFGKGDEAHMVYQFVLPPLVAHAVLRQNSRYLHQWANSLYLPRGKTYYFNFTASHDGIGLRPLSGLLNDQELQFMISKTIEQGGAVSYKKNSDGSESPYELNINYRSLLSDPKKDTHDYKAFLLSQAIALAMPGVPGIYFHSLIGSKNWSQGPVKTGHKRSINRQKLDIDDLLKSLDPNLDQGKLFREYKTLIMIRTKEPAFHPKAPFKCLWINERVFCFSRGRGSESLLCLFNLTGKKQKITLPSTWKNKELINILDKKVPARKANRELEAYGVCWLKSIKKNSLFSHEDRSH